MPPKDIKKVVPTDFLQKFRMHNQVSTEYIENKFKDLDVSKLPISHQIFNIDPL